jgi:hypothetical protein
MMIKWFMIEAFGCEKQHAKALGDCDTPRLAEIFNYLRSVAIASKVSGLQGFPRII